MTQEGPSIRDSIPAVILAGGLSRRMGGGDKGLLPFGDGTVLSSIIRRLAPQARPIGLNANGDPGRFAVLGLPVLPDSLPDRLGPLAGLLAAMEWATSLGADRVLTVPGDAPFLPPDLLLRLSKAGAPAIAASGGWVHPVVGLWPVTLAASLRHNLAQGLRRVEPFAQAAGATTVEFPIPPDSPDPFLNLNTPEDLAAARRWRG